MFSTPPPVALNVARESVAARKTRAKAIARGVAGDPDPEDRTSGYFAQLAESPEIDKLALAALLRRKRALPVTREGLAKVTNPVLVVLGDQDFAGPADPLIERWGDRVRRIHRLTDLKGIGQVRSVAIRLSGDEEPVAAG